jgi:hypothetical protein
VRPALPGGHAAPRCGPLVVDRLDLLIRDSRSVFDVLAARDELAARDGRARAARSFRGRRGLRHWGRLGVLRDGRHVGLEPVDCSQSVLARGDGVETAWPRGCSRRATQGRELNRELAKSRGVPGQNRGCPAVSADTLIQRGGLPPRTNDGGRRAGCVSPWTLDGLSVRSRARRGDFARLRPVVEMGMPRRLQRMGQEGRPRPRKVGRRQGCPGQA